MTPAEMARLVTLHAISAGSLIVIAGLQFAAAREAQR